MRKQQTLEAARRAKKWTQERLAAESGIDQSAISRLESGAVSNPSTGTVAALEQALDLRRGTLVFGPEAEALAS